MGHSKGRNASIELKGKLPAFCEQSSFRSSVIIDMRYKWKV